MISARVTLRGACLVLLLGSAGCGGKRPSQLLDRSQDDRIRQEVEARLAAEPSIGPGRVRVVVDGATVQLHGTVQGLGALKCAMSNAELVPGVRLVVDMMVLDRGPVAVQCLAPRASVPVVTSGT